MYAVTPFYRKLCRLWRKNLRILDEDCDVYTIWAFCPKAEWAAIQKIWGEGSLIHAQWFPVVYWLVFVISILGSIHSFSEFFCLFWCHRKHVTMWRKRKYYVIPCSVIRKCRLVGSLIMFNTWLLLWYALVNVSPNHMWPWLAINMIVLTLELFFWMVEVLMGTSKFEAQTVLSFGLPILNCFLVRSVFNVFKRSIELNETDDLSFWSKFR